MQGGRKKKGKDTRHETTNDLMSAPTVWRTLISEQVNSLCCWNLGEVDFHGAATVQRGFERLFESSAEYIETVILIFLPNSAQISSKARKPGMALGKAWGAPSFIGKRADVA